MIKLQTIQEEIREKKAAAQFKRQFNKLSPEEQQAIAMQMMQPEGEVPVEEAEPEFNFEDRYAANGNPQEQLGEEYGFANGGNLFVNGGLPYNNSNGFKYFNDGKYDQGYLDWLNTFDFDSVNSDNEDLKWIDFNNKYKELQDLYNRTFNKDLTVDEVRRLGQDQKFGKFHDILGQAYSTYKIAKERHPNIEKIYSKPINLFNTISVKDKPASPSEASVNSRINAIREGRIPIDDNSYNDWLRYAPAIGSGITAIADLFGANRPDYTNANMIGDLSRRIRNVRAPQLYNYLRFNPYDVNYEQNRIQNIGLGTQRNILGTTSGNRSAALAGILLGNNSTLSSIGDMFRTALEYNDTQRKTVSDFNRGTDQVNLQSVLSAEQANQNADIQRANYILQQARLRDEIDTATSAAISANRSNFFKNLGNIGNDNYYKAQTDWLIKSGAYPINEQTRRYPRKNGGKIRKPKRMI